MICILHGYLLEGSGSNLWTRAIIKSLCVNGETVHLFCQENHPDLYDFIAQVYVYHEDGTVEKTIDRQTLYTGKCIMHKPYIGKVLPVYVWDKYEEYTEVYPMTELDTDQIEQYLHYNVKALKQVIAENNITALHVNHAVLMSVVAYRLYEELRLPYSIMPHGSAIEYAVKKDRRFFDFALQAFSAAGKIFVIGKEIRQRVNALFPELEGLNDKMVDLNLGVDTALFHPVDGVNRQKNIQDLCKKLAKVERGKTPEMSSQLLKMIHPGISGAALLEAIKQTINYDAKKTDQDVETLLSAINWKKDRVIAFVGRIIASKGIHLILAALPLIFQKYPTAKLVVIGHGPLREPLEVLLWAFENGHVDLVKNIVRWGTRLEGSGDETFMEIEHFFNFLEQENRLADYFEAARQFISRERIIWTGYLTHKELCCLFPACDVAIFPSIVAEAGPLVFLEAMASGCLPIGTYFAGMAASIDSIQGAVSDEVIDCMKLSVDKTETVRQIADKVNRALSIDLSYKAALRKVTVEKYDWENISKKLSRNLYALREK